MMCYANFPLFYVLAVSVLFLELQLSEFASIFDGFLCVDQCEFETCNVK